MDQVKIGKFIKRLRKENHMTQEQLAEKMGVTDKSVSRWENGKTMPDSSIMLVLCNELKITVNELLNGEKIDMNEYNKKTEELILQLAKQDEIKNKKLFMATWTIGAVSTISYLSIIFLTNYTLKKGSLLITINIAATIIFFIALFITLKFEADAGYYECKNCHHKFIPTYKEVFFSTHTLTTRHLRCPQCHKKTWAKKVMTK